MYPNLYFFFKQVFGVEWQGLKLINSFGLMVALAFIAAAIALTAELRRREANGWLHFTENSILVGKGADWGEVMWNAFFGFILGWKFVGFLLNKESVYSDPQSYILSGEGSIAAGILLALLLGGIKWYSGNKTKLAKPEKRTIRVWPNERVGDMIILAAIFGFGGAKIFHNLENWDELVADPVGALLSFSGLTFYGGLICAGAAIVWYAHKHKINLWHLTDSFGPALMLAYQDTVTRYLAYHQQSLAGTKEVANVDDVMHAYFKAPSWMPTWMVAYTYPNNVLSDGVPLDGCEGQWCRYLPNPVFPTPFYETVMGLILFGILWGLRKRILAPGMLFGLYLVFNGFERFWIEKIRVNTTYKWGFWNPTQAEIIAIILMLLGISIILLRKGKRPVKVTPS
jgi:phosphatidylglycerol---prolipoprotein diacylglyceryl transferase